ncbi:MAG: hypothetical protein OEL76_12100 [Siculibacillus sp.]|nr:hypothetical protein [Siculibacillus sp.]
MGAASPTIGETRRVATATVHPRVEVAVATIVSAVFAAAATALPLVAQLISPLVGVPLAAAIAAVVALGLPGLVPAVLIFATMFQNLIVSLLSPAIPDADAFNFIRGYAFLSTVVVWLVLVGGFLLAPRAHTPLVRLLVRRGLWLLMIVGVFAAIGLVRNGSAAIIYTRNIVTPILLLHIMLLIAERRRLAVGPVFLLYAILLFACGWLEMTSRETWLVVTNGHAYWTLNSAGMAAAGYWEQVLKQTGFVYTELIDFFRIHLFNTHYFSDIEVLRLHGPNIHAVSFGYALAFMALHLIASGRWWLAVFAVPLLVLASAKGAFVVVVFVIAAWTATRLIGPRPALVAMLVLAAVYAAAMFLNGLATGDYHIIGLVGGLKGFASNPIGHAIGSGGNLTATVTLDEWNKAQEMGSFEGAVESAVGVLLYQMGAAGLLVLAYYLDVARAAWRRYARSGLLHQGLAAFGTLVVVVNGLFQEEALFSPLALGLMAAFAGLVLGAAERVDAREARSTGT